MAFFCDETRVSPHYFSPYEKRVRRDAHIANVSPPGQICVGSWENELHKRDLGEQRTISVIRDISDFVTRQTIKRIETESSRARQCPRAHTLRNRSPAHFYFLRAPEPEVRTTHAVPFPSDSDHPLQTRNVRIRTSQTHHSNYVHFLVNCDFNSRSLCVSNGFLPASSSSYTTQTHGRLVTSYFRQLQTQNLIKLP